MTQMTTCDLHNETIARLERELNEARAEVSGALEQIDRLIKKSGDEWERANRAEAKLAAKPDVAGLVKRLREGDHGFDRNGSHSEDRYVCLCEHLANEAADALLSLSAQLAEKEAECEGKQAKIDALMLEYCPNEMSAEQVARWAGCQVGSGELLPTDAARKP